MPINNSELIMVNAKGERQHGYLGISSWPLTEDTDTWPKKKKKNVIHFDRENPDPAGSMLLGWTDYRIWYPTIQAEGAQGRSLSCRMNFKENEKLDAQQRH
ncbi:predicted protein [Histoplasma capsulatum H143]|uniref:Uncharacterized protein n=1 Tax=Ajellomyces capsulatus (strain H143) TaxID=544712 RepID=C6H2L4_AJECH|nr:predicted protein [Histoplasma capsulatum H143]